MKHFTRILSLIVMVVFAVSAMQAQNNVMTKAQALGIETSGTVQTPAFVDNSSSRAILLEEGFDFDWLPDGWTVINTHPENNWIQTNPVENPFSDIDPNSLFSAMVPFINEDQDEWLISPTIDASGGDLPLTLTWYAGVSGSWLDPGATLRCLISTDDGATWTELWNAIGEIEDGAPWAWHMVTANLDAYASTPFKLAWNYVGNDGDLAGVDGVKVQAGYTYLY